MTYDAIVFDVDGVLTHPTAAETRRTSVVEAFESFGVDPSSGCVDAVLHGSLERIRRVCADHDIDVRTFWREREARAVADLRAALESGAKRPYEDAEALPELDGSLGVAGDVPHGIVEVVLDVVGLDVRVEAAYGREPSITGFRRRMPSAYYLQRALDDLDAESALYVGDSNAAVLAADRAGTDVAFLRRSHRAGYELSTEPTYELRSLCDLPAVANGGGGENGSGGEKTSEGETVADD